MCWGWKIIIFGERNIFPGPQGPTGTILVPVELKLVPRFGLLPSPPYSYALGDPTRSPNFEDPLTLPKRIPKRVPKSNQTKFSY